MNYLSELVTTFIQVMVAQKEKWKCGQMGLESRHQYTNRIRYESYHIQHVKVCAHRASMSMSVTVTAQQVGICVRIFKFF